MISGASLQIWSVLVGHKLVVQLFHRQESSGSACFDCRWDLQLRMAKSHLLCFRPAIWQLPKIAISTL